MHPVSTPWKYRFPDVFRRQRRGALGINRLTKKYKIIFRKSSVRTEDLEKLLKFTESNKKT